MSIPKVISISCPNCGAHLQNLDKLFECPYCHTLLATDDGSSKPKSDEIPVSRGKVGLQDSDYVTAIDPISVRALTVKIVAPYANQNAWNWHQPAAIYDYLKQNVKYVMDPAEHNYISPPLETLQTGGGDCEDQAILFASMCAAVRIPARLVICCSTDEKWHCLAQVNFGKVQNAQTIRDNLKSFYRYRASGKVFAWETDDNGNYWVFADLAMCQYFGDKDNLVKGRYLSSSSNPGGAQWLKKVRYLYLSSQPTTPRGKVIVRTHDGETYHSQVSNIVENVIHPSINTGKVTYNRNTMWHSAQTTKGWVAVEIEFPTAVDLTGVGIHTQHSGIYHAAEAVRISAMTGRQEYRLLAESPLKTVDARVSIPRTKAQRWKFDFKTGKSGYVVVRGLQFFSGDQEIYPAQHG
ncbi:MAG: hypothetical protein GYA17_11625 [Chloroflexi bacterium]|nr:hypothetical protein [Chloroflexota bacterium]